MMALPAETTVIDAVSEGASGTKVDIPCRSVPLLKRSVDLLLAPIFLIMFAPIMVLIAILIRCTSRGPAILCQTRIGRGGKPFTLYKFRTMEQGDWSKVHARVVSEQLKVGSEDGKRFKNDHLYRLTSVGGFLRHSSLDELPQIWNVLRGTMSLVGPRPCMPYEIAFHKVDQLARLSVLPGMTGLWQVSGRSEKSYGEMIALDLEYVKRSSIALDFVILLRTPFALFKAQ